jgi:hypothetical protein
MPPLTADDVRVENLLDGVRSVLSGLRLVVAQLADGQVQLVAEARKTNALLREQLERMPRHTNGSVDHEITEEHDHG